MNTVIRKFVEAHDRYLALEDARFDCTAPAQREAVHIEILKAYLEVQHHALQISLDRASLEQALATARDSGVPILLAPGAVTEPVQETSQRVSVPSEPSAVAETPPPVQAPPAEPFVAAEIATEPFVAAEEAP